MVSCTNSSELGQLLIKKRGGGGGLGSGAAGAPCSEPVTPRGGQSNLDGDDSSQSFKIIAHQPADNSSTPLCDLTAALALSSRLAQRSRSGALPTSSLPSSHSAAAGGGSCAHIGSSRGGFADRQLVVGGGASELSRRLRSMLTPGSRDANNRVAANPTWSPLRLPTDDQSPAGIDAGAEATGGLGAVDGATPAIILMDASKVGSSVKVDSAAVL
jgi:hypothetical protein